MGIEGKYGKNAKANSGMEKLKRAKKKNSLYVMSYELSAMFGRSQDLELQSFSGVV